MKETDVRQKILTRLRLTQFYTIDALAKAIELPYHTIHVTLNQLYNEGLVEKRKGIGNCSKGKLSYAKKGYYSKLESSKKYLIEIKEININFKDYRIILRDNKFIDLSLKELLELKEILNRCKL